jgi:hypothetical protein
MSTETTVEPTQTMPELRLNARSGQVQPAASPAVVTVKKPDVPTIGALGKVDNLSDAEYIDLMTCEGVIETGWRTFIDVGMALAQIRDEQLYRGQFITFEAYYRAKWHFDHNKVYSWIAAARVFRTLVPLNDVPKPEYEAQLRPLYALTAEQAQTAWKHAASKASTRGITARLVREAITELHLSVQEQGDNKAKLQERGERRRLLNEGITELLKLIITKSAYELLLEKAAAVEGHVRFLFPQSKRNK